MDKEKCRECEHYILQTDYAHPPYKAKPACDLLEDDYGDFEFLVNINKCPKRKRK